MTPTFFDEKSNVEVLPSTVPLFNHIGEEENS